MRSVGLAKLLKDEGMDALACGARDNSAETLATLFEWANVVVLLSEQIKKHIPKELANHPVVVVEVGRDRFGRATHRDLVALLRPVVDRWKAAHWRIEA